MASKSLNIQSVIHKFNAVVQYVLRYMKLIFIVVLLAMYGFLVFRINTLTGAEPSDEAIAEKLQTVQRPKIDKSAVEKIQQLQDNSSEVQSLFQAARDNPFHE